MRACVLLLFAIITSVQPGKVEPQPQSQQQVHLFCDSLNRRSPPWRLRPSRLGFGSKTQALNRNELLLLWRGCGCFSSKEGWQRVLLQPNASSLMQDLCAVKVPLNSVIVSSPPVLSSSVTSTGPMLTNVC